MKKKSLKDYIEAIRKEAISEGYTDRPIDNEEIYMVSGDLRKINDLSSKIYLIIKKNQCDIEEWNQVKIAKAADYLSSVHDYLAYTNVNDENE
jgi:hypothetical protein